MGKIPYFNYAAFALLMLILLSALFRDISVVKGNKAFLVATVAITITTVFDIFAIGYDINGAGNVLGKWISHAGYLYFHTLTSFFYLFYLIALTDTWDKIRKSKIRFVIILTPVVLFTVFFALNFVGEPWTFYINEADVYTRGRLFIVNYIVAALYLVYGLYYIIKYRALYSIKWIITLFIPYPIIGAAMIVEYFYPKAIVEMFFNALGVLFVYINIQKPEELMDSATGLGNVDAFEKYCRHLYFNRKTMNVIMVDVTNYDSIKDILDFESSFVFRKSISNYLSDINRKLSLKADCFYGHHGRFFMFIDERKADSVEEAAELLHTRFNHSISISNTELHPRSSVCVAKVPDDISDLMTFLHFSNNEFHILAEDKINYVSDLFKEEYYKILLNIDSIIADGLENNRFEVYYQPLYSVKDKRYISAEALLRLKNPEHGFISPAIVIPAAEQSGAIFQIWDFVINSVCRFIASEEFHKLDLCCIEVNLSAVQCMQEKLAEQIISQIDKYGINHEHIALEVTETALTFNPEILKENLERLSNAGITICLDDYGTGYSDTRRVLDLPLDIVKLDKSFLQGSEDQKIQTIIAGTIKLLKDVGIKVVAEGVETEGELNMLEGFGCDEIQGYYFDRPMPLDEFIESCKK